MTENQDHDILAERMLLGIPVIDKQHENLIRITNNMDFAYLKGAETADFRFIQAAHKAINFIRHHIATEEKLMSLADFSGYPDHKKEHENFMGELLIRSRRLEGEHTIAPKEFEDFVREWGRYHIAVSDKAFADFFLNMQEYSKLRLILAGEPHLSSQPA